MAASVLYMSMSLDGFIAEPSARGDEDPSRLHEWLSGGEHRPSGVNGQVVDEFMATGAVVAGRGTLSRRAAGAATTTTVCPPSS